MPNGRELDDPHYAYKLAWLAALAAETRRPGSRRTPTQPLALMGDWNVAPLDADVWDPAVFEGSTHISQPERAAFAAFEAAGLTDVVRPLVPDRLHLLGLQAAALPAQRGHADRLHPRLATRSPTS